MTDFTGLKDSRIIKHISYLVKGERKILEADRNGTFRMMISYELAGRTKTEYKNLTAREVINHPSVINSDPVLTLKTGEKIRVFDGGKSRYLPAMSDGIIERNDRYEMLKRKFLKDKIARSNKREKEKKNNNNGKDVVDLSDYDSPFMWDDYDYYDD
jgi:hypothetical protein